MRYILLDLTNKPLAYTYNTEDEIRAPLIELLRHHGSLGISGNVTGKNMTRHNTHPATQPYRPDYNTDAWNLPTESLGEINPNIFYIEGEGTIGVWSGFEGEEWIGGQWPPEPGEYLGKGDPYVFRTVGKKGRIRGVCISDPAVFKREAPEYYAAAVEEGNIDEVTDADIPDFMQ